MKAILRSINNFSCKLKQSNNLKYNISPKIRSNKYKSISGNGNIVIEDAIKKDLKDYKIYGNTYQNSTSGKNLFNSSIVNWQKNNLDGNIKYEENRNIIKFVTTPVRISGIYIGKNSVPGLINNFNATTEYTISFEITSDKNIGTTRFGFENNYLNVPLRANETKKIVQKSTYGAIVIYFQNAEESANVEVKNIMITSNDNVNFEPYTGGHPSSNPDYPQEMVSCGDRTKNLFDTSKVYERISDRGINISVENKDVKVIGTNSTNNAIGVALNDVNDYYSLKAGKTYVAKYITGQTASANTYRMDIREYNNTANILAFERETDGLIYTPTEDINIRFAIRIPANGTVDLSGKIIFEESDVLHDYEPYGKYKIPVNVRSDNLFDKNNANLVHLYTDGAIVKSSNTANSYFIMCKPNTTYTIIKSNTGTNNRFCVFTCDDIPTAGMQILNYIGTPAGADNSTKYTINAPNTAKYLCVFVGVASTTPSANEISNSIQILEGSTVPDKYIPYYNETTNIYLDEPLRKIDGYSDYIDFINGKIARQIGETIFDGSETWNKVGDTSGNYFYFYSTVLDNIVMKDITKNMLCNKFNVYNGQIVYITKVNTDTINVSNRTSKERLRVLLLNTRINSYTTANFKTWLSENNVTVDYVLETPTEEDIELPNIKLIEGKNIITIGTEVQGVFEAEYYSKEIIDISDYKYNLRKVED